MIQNFYLGGERAKCTIEKEIVINSKKVLSFTKLFLNRRNIKNKTLINQTEFMRDLRITQELISIYCIEISNHFDLDRIDNNLGSYSIDSVTNLLKQKQSTSDWDKE